MARIFFILFMLVEIRGEEPTVQIKTKNGLLEGEKGHTIGGREYHKFWCIPYAKHERFEPSEPADPWEGILDATHCDRRCPEVPVSLASTPSQLTLGSPEHEDCLILNIFTPVTDGRDAKYPVMIYIHGGYFIAGSSIEYSGELFLDDDIVLVTINYRLGALGFLTSGDGVLEANLGLKDQVEALKWIQENVATFGGDPNRVTIFGAEAGGSSVALLILSPLTTGLFHRAIAQSGTALNPWAYQSNPGQMFREFVALVNCSAASTKESVACLKKLDSDDINEYLVHKEWFFDMPHPVYPAIEYVPGTSPVFLPNHPKKLLKEGKFQHVPLICGVVEDEMALLTALIMSNSEHMAELNSQWKSLGSHTLGIHHRNFSAEALQQGLAKIRKFYFGQENNPIDTHQAPALLNMLSDSWYIHGLDVTIRAHSKFAPVYPYVFAQKGGSSLTDNVMGQLLHQSVVSHGEDVPYLFARSLSKGKSTKLFAVQFRKLWTSFASEGIPTATWEPQKEWPAVQPDAAWDYNLYVLADETALIPNPFKSRAQFQDELRENDWKEF